MTPIAATLRERAERLAKEIAKRARIRVHVGGEVGLGKSTYLLALAEQLALCGLKPLLIAPPLRAVDSGVAVIAQIADQLRHGGVLNGDGTIVEDPRTALKTKLDILEKAVEAKQQRTVLLCDEPAQWLGAAGPEGSDEDFFVQERKLAVFEAINRWKCSVAFAGALPKMPLGEKLIEHKLPFDVITLADQTFGTLSETAAELGSRLGGPMAVSTSLWRRLLVGYARASSVGAAVALGENSPDVWLIARRLWECVSTLKQFAELHDLWAKLALFRRPFDRPFVENLGARALDAESRAIFDNVLLQEYVGDYMLHDVLRRVAMLHRLETSWVGGAHAEFAEFFHDRLKGADAPHRLAERVEGFHHAALAGRSDARKLFPEISVEQLHVQGRARSKIYGDHAGAAEIFAQAVAIDDEDDYAHHYWAYNLDWEAADEDLSEREYREALRINRSHPWWWSRWINFLITTGRLAEARREWSQAHVALGVPDCDPQDRVWWALHLWVIRLLLHRGQTDFARFVLSDVPDQTRRHDAQFVALHRLLRFLEEVDAGDSVFPWSVPPDDWWTVTPFRLGLTLERGDFHLHDWNPARVLDIDEANVRLVAAKRPVEHNPRPTYGTLIMPREEFDAASPDVKSSQLEIDRYLVLAHYRDTEEEELVIACHPREAEMDRDLPGFDPPDPRRYLKRSRKQRAAS